MKYLITGGAGFIGSAFCHYMLRHHPNDEFVCLDALTYAGNLNNLAGCLDKSNFRFIKGDITDRDLVDDLFRRERFDVVVNFAAETHVDNSISDPGRFLMSNIIGTGVLLDAVNKHHVSRFHQISTDEVYGDLPLDSTYSFKETDPLRPSSPYAASKASADLLVLAYHRTYGIPVTISRCSNNYGPHQYPEKLIPKTIALAKADQPIPVYGDGRNIRDWIDVEEHCRLIDLILLKGMIGEIYNIAGHQELTNLEVVRKILQRLGKPESLITFVADRPGHDRRYSIDDRKIQALADGNRRIGC